MKNCYKEFTLVSKHETELINITENVHSFVSTACIKSGMVYVISFHTTTGITVNEPLPDLESDIATFLNKIVDENEEYRHARFLHSDGQMAINAPSHLRQAVLGFEVFFPIENGKLKVEADNPFILLNWMARRKGNIALKPLAIKTSGFSDIIGKNIFLFLQKKLLPEKKK